MITFIFNEILYKPLFNLLIFLYQTVAFHDLGVAIIILTILIRLALYPLSKKSIQAQKEMSAIQPEIKKTQEQYKHNKEEQMKRVMALYKEKKVNPLSGCLPILIQLPILIALYRVFLAGFNDGSLDYLYGFMSNPGKINHMFLGLIDISSKKNIILAVIAGGLQFYQSKIVVDEQMKHRPPATRESGERSGHRMMATDQKQDDFATSMSKQMTYMMPIMTTVISYTLPAGLALYWAATTSFSIIQQWMVFKKKNDR